LVLGGADRECCAFGAKTTTRKRFAGSGSLIPHQLRFWKPGSYAAWISLHAPNALGPLHLEGTTEIPSVPCPRKAMSFAACTCVKEARTARHQRRASDLRCCRVEFLPRSSSANRARTLATS